jgi:hypothetical protein
MKKSMSLKGRGGWFYVIGVVIALIIAIVVAVYYFGKV